MTELHNVEFRDNDFVLVQENEKIKDVKFETKPTTFMKDAWKRFRKNKSSVAGSIILGILIILALVVPVVSPYNITNVSTSESFLAPKLFEAGTGFWDGTRTKKHIVYDKDNEVPALSDKYSIAAIKNALVSIDVDAEPTYIDSASVYGTGGYAVIATDATIENKPSKLTSQSINFTVRDNYAMEVTLGDTEGVSDSKLGVYSIKLVNNAGETVAVLKEKSTDYGVQSINISDALKKAGLNNLSGRIQFEVESSTDAFRYILLETVKITANATAPDAAKIDAASIYDATDFINTADTKSDAYWSCTGRKGIYHSAIYYCNYVIDTYELVYGNADAVSYSATELKTWIDNGWCEYDYKVGPESFVRLSDECPIDVVIEQSVMKVTGKLSSILASGYNYRKLGYTSMPKFIMGTDASGFDAFKRAFAGLRTSLALSTITAAFCMGFGLVWGSISGYFGGRVDLFMERFCEILGGVPLMVVMTLAILHLGNNFTTFVMALCLTSWIGTAATTRTQFYRFKGREYILASRTLGSSDMRLIFRHILPNSLGTIVTASVLRIPAFIFTEATLAYLNLGLQGKQSFGVMMSTNQQYLAVFPNLVIFPATILALMMISFNLFGNGLRDALNPSLKGSD